MKKILGVKVDDINMDEAVDTVESWLKKLGKHYIVTPNPEFLVTAQKDEEFKLILNNADLVIPDGVGLKLGGVKNNVAGTDLMEKLVELASEKGYSVGLLGGKTGVAAECAERLKKRYPKLRIAFTDYGGLFGVLPARSPIVHPHSHKLVAATRWGPPLAVTPHNPLIADLLFVAFGHPKQEKWIYENLPKIPVKVAMGVGGAFDYISGKVPRAPKWIRSLGLEWLFRLIIQPWRIKRQVSLLHYIWLLTKHS